MTTIKYEIDGVEVELEVEDEFATTYVQFCESEKKAAARYRWHKRKNLTDLDGLIDAGVQLEDKSSNFVDDYSETDMVNRAMAVLTEKQRTIIRLYYFEELTQPEIAERLGATQQLVAKTIKAALLKMKTFLEN